VSGRFGAGFAELGRPAGEHLEPIADLLTATRVAIAEALEGLSGPPDLVTVFASGPAAPELDRVGSLAQELSGAAHVIGCSAAGVCAAGRAVLGAAGVSVFAAVLPGARSRVFHLEVMRSGDGLAVVGLPELREDEKTAVLLADPYSFPVVSFVDRSSEALPGVQLVGGLGGGPSGAGSTRLYIDGRTVDRGAVGLLIAGVPTQVVVSQGCRPVGPEMVVTKADGNVLLELAGEPALDRLYAVLNELEPAERATFGSAPQLGVAMNEYTLDHELGDYLIRGVIGIDESRKAVAVADVVDVGRTVRFQLRDANAARADLRTRLAPAAAAEGALLFSCNGRGPAMFGRAESDVELVSECLAGAPVGGLFAGGEIGPVGGRNWLHGFTASVLAFI
jgi:small ligand-binding sensory domain FIST